ncbi:unnamed protein product [Caenorhabditis angaria]|uniref:SXP/RAL-2 family protein Ani s 5-like cation-binding domain-containing protein n=1 Tax=Caenorhabditis angaria TaxID=860376 RepID=A0A9P1IS44_9PELO|nr:unnamed protein product [Caenorhabditis angaria]
MKNLYIFLLLLLLLLVVSVDANNFGRINNGTTLPEFLNIATKCNSFLDTIDNIVNHLMSTNAFKFNWSLINKHLSPSNVELIKSVWNDVISFIHEMCENGDIAYSKLECIVENVVLDVETFIKSIQGLKLFSLANADQILKIVDELLKSISNASKKCSNI